MDKTCINIGCNNTTNNKICTKCSSEYMGNETDYNKHAQYTEKEINELNKAIGIKGGKRRRKRSKKRKTNKRRKKTKRKRNKKRKTMTRRRRK